MGSKKYLTTKILTTKTLRKKILLTRRKFLRENIF